VAWMSEHSSTLLAREPVEVLVNQHVIVEAVLARERRVADEAHKRLYTYNRQHMMIIMWVKKIIIILQFLKHQFHRL